MQAEIGTEDVVNPPVAESHEADSDVQKRNIIAMREALKEQKEIALRQQQEISELKGALKYGMQPKQEVEEDPWAGLDDDDALEVSKAKKVVAKEAQRYAEKAVENALKKQNSSPEALEARIRAKYSDFDAVVSQENIEQIVKANPSVHNMVVNSPDPLEAAYQYIANSAAYYNKKQTGNKHMVERAKIEQNQAKPKSPNTVATTQDAASSVHFGRLTKSQQKELWVEHAKKLGRRV